MQSAARAIANQLNAQKSTGPRTPEGRAKSSRNATKFGLFSTEAAVRPEERDEYDTLAADLNAEFAPATATEQTFAKLALHATWRLRRCDRIEAALGPEELSASIDRARAQAANSLRRALNELRKLQTERRLRAELLLSEADTATHGLASYKEIVSILAKHAKTKRTQPAGPALTMKDLEELLDKTNPFKGVSSISEITKRTQPLPGTTQPNVARNAPCPCRSGEKYKRCCGRTAPGLINQDFAA